MKKNILLIIILFAYSICPGLYAQLTIEIPVNGPESEVSYSAYLDKDGNIYLGGYAKGQTNAQRFTTEAKGNSDFMLIKINDQKNIDWLNTGGNFVSEDMIISDYCKFVKENSAGEIIIAGIFNGKGDTKDRSTLISNGEGDIFVACYSEMGELLWMKNYGGPGHEFINDICIDKNDNIFMAVSLTAPFKCGNVQIKELKSGLASLLCIDAEGNMKWMNVYQGKKSVTSVAINTDYTGNFYWGLTYEDDITDRSLQNNGKEDIYIEKRNADNEILWSQTIGGNGRDKLKSIHIDENNNILLLGTFTESISFGSIQFGSRDNYDIFMAKYSAAGDLLNVNSIGGLGFDEPSASTLLDNRLLFACNFNDIMLDEERSVKAYDRDALLVFCDENLEVSHTTHISGIGAENVTSINTNDSQILLSGYYYADIKIDSEVQYSSGSADIFYILTDLSELFGDKSLMNISDQKTDHMISITPNPTRSIIMIESSKYTHFNKLEICDASGKTIFQCTDHSFPYSYNLDGNNPGIYLVKLRVNDQQFTEKIVLE